jgi:D-alanyl-D-alanine carboxypeptidase
MVPVAPDKTISLTLPRAQRDDVKVEAFVAAETEAPITKGQSFGKLVLRAPDHDPIEISLIAMEDVERLGFFDRAVLKIKRMLGKE